MNYIEAVDEIFGVCKTAWDIATPGIIGLAQPAEIRWPGAQKPGAPGQDVFWGRVSFQTVTDGKVAMGDASAPELYEAQGLFYLQIFCPKNRRDALPLGRAVALTVQNAFRCQSPSGNVWFRNQIIRDAPPSPDHNQLTVVVTCTYTDFKQPNNVITDTYGAFIGQQILQTLSELTNTDL